ncbi:MAG: rRNA maturation RNase YbeY [Cyclobacteriaceae bacterium]|nr:rRNA maturation RNase YbeY [Cyclobacteriaceae bacterium]
MGVIRFFAEDLRFKPQNPGKTSNWLKNVVETEGGQLEYLNIIFCSDEYLSQINKKFLNHSTLTDIVTFDNSTLPKRIEGELYISIPRIRDNATKFQSSFDSELHRVMVHGILHLLGYNDKTGRQKSKMRKTEDAYLSLR